MKYQIMGNNNNSEKMKLSMEEKVSSRESMTKSIERCYLQ